MGAKNGARGGVGKHGPYKFLWLTPGVEPVLEAFNQYWRKAPNVKQLVLKSIPDETTRLAAGGVLQGIVREEVPGLIHDRAIVAPIWLNAGPSGPGPRVEESGIGLIAGFAWSGPYEDVKLKIK